MAKFKVPKKVYFTDVMPKTATERGAEEDCGGGDGEVGSEDSEVVRQVSVVSGL